MQFLDKVFDGDRLSQPSSIMAMFLLDAEMLAELTKHLNDLSCSLLGEQIDLQVEMITTIRNDPHTILLDQHECREQHRFQ